MLACWCLQWAPRMLAVYGLSASPGLHAPATWGAGIHLLAPSQVSKGPKSQEVLQLARERGALAVRGNHDDAGLAAWHRVQRGEEVEGKWQCELLLAAGVQVSVIQRIQVQYQSSACCIATICCIGGASPRPAMRPESSSRKRSCPKSSLPPPPPARRLLCPAGVKGLTPADAALLEELPFSLHLPDYGLVVVHAGLVPGVSLQHQQMLHMCKMRDLRQLPNGRWVGVSQRVQATSELVSLKDKLPPMLRRRVWL